jgi:3-methylcrotonyl-CoA carboxylase beta subunit
MGGEQAASVLAEIQKDNLARANKSWTPEQEEEFKRPTRERYDKEGHPYYSSARLWDDGVIAPEDTRTVVGLALRATLNAPIEKTNFGVFRM